MFTKRSGFPLENGLHQVHGGGKIRTRVSAKGVGGGQESCQSTESSSRLRCSLWSPWNTGSTKSPFVSSFPSILLQTTFTLPSSFHLNYNPGPEKAMAPHSSTLVWEIPWMEEPGRLQSMGSLKVRHDWATSLSLFTFMHWRRKWQPTPVFLPGESQGRRSLVGCRLWGRTEWTRLKRLSSSITLYSDQEDVFIWQIWKPEAQRGSKTLHKGVHAGVQMALQMSQGPTRQTLCVWTFQIP